MSDNPKVFISYSHQDDEYENKILDFSNRLRSEGIDANVDLYEESPKEGWPRWMENQIRVSDFVLIVSSKSYHDKYYLDKEAKGISWEVNIVYQYLYDANSKNKKFIPILFDADDVQYIPTPIKPFTYYNVSEDKEYNKLYWRLRGLTQTQKPPLGKLKPLPEKQKKAMFFSSPIDLEKWNAAGWNGMLYMFAQGCNPVLGILYKDYAAAKSIFKEWKKEAERDSADEFLQVDYIIPPFPKDCWVYSDPERNYGKGYFVHIGPNVDKSICRAMEAGISPDELLLTVISRYQWMDEINGSQNREIFKHYIDDGINYLLMPIGIRDQRKPIEEDNLIIDFDYAIEMKKAIFRAGVDIKDNDFCKAVLIKNNGN